MAAKKTVFNEQWLDLKLNPEFVGWLGKGPDKFQAYCKQCKKTFGLANMGRQALVSHAKGIKHKQLTKMSDSQSSLRNFFNAADPTITTEEIKATKISDECSKVDASQPGTSKCGISPRTIPEHLSVEPFCLTDDVARAEVLWALRIVNNSKMSIHSCADLGETFRLMFPDSAIASKFKMGETKCSYVINHGLAPYFDQLLKDRLSVCNDYVVCFDESLNKVVQRGQMDLFIRFFDSNTNKVCTHYFNSVFLEHATSEKLLNSFTLGILPLPLKNILSISMDGPNVNLSFLKKYEEKMKEDNGQDDKMLVNTGVCGLHVVNGAIKTGLESVNWDLHNFLRDIYYIFNESPARRSDFTSVTGRKCFPLKYCTTRWLENVPCLERGLLLFDDVKKFIEKSKAINSKPYRNVCDLTKDKFMKCKLAFFKTLSTECQPFLRKYQSSSPLAPYLFEDLQYLIINLMERFVKSTAIPTTVQKLFALDLSDNENLRTLKNIDIGFQTKKLLNEMVTSEAEVLKFRMECQQILKKMTIKILERSPLKYKAIQGLSSLDPTIIFKQPDQGKIRFNTLLDTLYTKNRLSERVAQKGKAQYSFMCTEAHSALEKQFKEFLEKDANSSQRLDDFFSSILLGNQQYQDLWHVVKLCLIFSHGNAAVESGFSVNNSLLVENLHEESLISQRKVYDAIRYYGSIQKVPITQKMLTYVRNSRRLYEGYLESARRNQTEEDKIRDKKRKLQDEIKKLEEKKKIVKMEKRQEEEAIEARIKFLQKQTVD